MITHVKDFVHALGGVKTVAEIVKASETAVYMSYQRGIPGSWQLPLYIAAQRRRIKYSPKLLGLDS